MDKHSCKCTYTTKKFSGPGAPLNEPISLHFRGPISLKQFAVYTADNKKSKRSEKHLRRHAHGHKHKRVAEPALEVVTEYTTAYTTVETEVTVAPVPNYVKSDGPSPGSSHPPTVKPDGPSPAGPSPPAVKPGTAKSDTVDLSSAGTFKRQAYYHSGQGVSEGLVFMNHRGGQGSGDFDMDCLGQSISYASKDNSAGSSKPEILGDITTVSDDEFIIFSDKKCEGDECGFYRPGIPAYRGFGGDIRVVLAEFSMPRDKGDAGGKGGHDLPAIWALNAQIPRVAQYGIKSGSCSCWPDCGEFDIFEALPGNPAAGQSAADMMKSHLHCAQGGKFGGGGNVDFFERPLNEPIKLAAIFYGENVYITKLPKDTTFDKTLSEELIANAKDTKSMFKIPS